MEIERKFLIKHLPTNLSQYKYHMIEQGYLSRQPVVRIRKEDESYYLTYKGKGLMVREEYNLPLTKESYEHLLKKVDGTIISKTRYLIPYSCSYYTNGVEKQISFTIELDVFSGKYDGLLLAEVEFESEELANLFTPPEWFLEDVTFNKTYHNSNMAYGDFQ